MIGCEEPDFLSYTAQAGPEVLDQEGGDECKWEAVAREGSDSLPGEPALELWGFLAYSRMAEVD